MTVGLLPLLIQLRITAKRFDQFLYASRKDLVQIAEDVRASRMQMNHIVGSLQTSLEDLSSFTRVMGEIGVSIKNLHSRFHNSFESASAKAGVLLGGINALLAFFESRQTPNNP